MDLQFFGANCITVTYKGVRIVIDDTLESLGAKNITKPDDVVLFTGPHPGSTATGRLMFDSPGEYEISDISVVAIPERAHMDEDGEKATMFKLIAGDMSVLITGHVHPDISDNQLERVGLVDVMIVPVGGCGYTLDPIGALKLIKAIEPKLVIPTHYAMSGITYPVPQIDLDSALKDLAMEPKERVAKLKLKPTELSDVTQLIILEKS